MHINRPEPAQPWGLPCLAALLGRAERAAGQAVTGGGLMAALAVASAGGDLEMLSWAWASSQAALSYARWLHGQPCRH